MTNCWGDSSLVNVTATTGLNTSGSTVIPTPSTFTPIWQDLAVHYNSQGWTRITTIFTPSSNFSQIWFYPFWDAIGGGQVEMNIDNVSIEHIGAGNYTVNPTNATICPGQSVQLNASGGHAYSWSPATGLSCTDCPNPVASPLTTTTYTVNIMDYRNCEPVANPRQVTVNVPGCSVSYNFTYATQMCNDVQFNQSSMAGPCTQITGWYWDFGDNTSSTLPNPLHTYANPGTYNVCLTTVGYDGNQTCRSKQCYTVTAGYCEVNANYSYSYTDNCTEVQFDNLSTPGPCSQVTGWYWDFGYPGGISTQQNPLHNFPSTGTYTVCLTTQGTNGYVSSTDDTCFTVTVGRPCDVDADFAFYLPNPGPGGCLDYQFFDLSSAAWCTRVVQWHWDFGYPGGTSNQQTPFVTFPGAGTYTVCLTAYGDNGNVMCFDTFCQTITVGDPCSVNADFSYGIDPANCEFYFNDISTANPCTQITNWYWDFGDGSTSTLQNPSHQFMPGTYTVCLTTYGQDGYIGCSDQICQTITVPSGSVTADFSWKANSCTVQFDDLSLLGPCTTSGGWYWDFGDGTTSNQQNPSHTYAASGTYMVCLTAFGYDNFMGYADQKCYMVTVNCGGCPCSIQSDFIYSADRCDLQFYDNTHADPCMTITGWSWDFGYAGATSTQQHPFHSFPASGTYNVCLTVFGHNGTISCTNTYCFLVNVDCNAPIRPSGGSPYTNGELKDIQVYPNPVSTDVFIEFTNEALQAVEVDVLSTAGQIIAKVPIEKQAEPYYSIKWSPKEEGIAEGVYYLQIKIGGSVTHHKVIFSH